MVYVGQNNGTPAHLPRASNTTDDNNGGVVKRYTVILQLFEISMRIKACRYGSQTSDTRLCIYVSVALQSNGMRICFSEPCCERVKYVLDKYFRF